MFYLLQQPVLVVVASGGHEDLLQVDDEGQEAMERATREVLKTQNIKSFI